MINQISSVNYLSQKKSESKKTNFKGNGLKRDVSDVFTRSNSIKAKGISFKGKEGEVSDHDIKTISDFVKNPENRGKFIVIKESRGYNEPAGYYTDYVDRNGKEHKYSDYKYEEMGSYSTVAKGLSDEKEYDEAAYVMKENKIKDENLEKIIAKYMVEEGRDDEAMELYPELEEDINRYLCDIKSRYVPTGSTPKAKNLNEMYEQRKKHDFDDAAEGNLFDLRYKPYGMTYKYSAWNSNNEIYEPLSHHYDSDLAEAQEMLQEHNLDEKEIEKYKKSISSKMSISDHIFHFTWPTRATASLRQAINAVQHTIQNAKLAQIETKQQEVFNLVEVEKQKEPVKAEISDKFILPLIELNQGNNVKLPNCIMLTGKNPYVMQELIDWTGENADANYVKLPSMYSKKDMRKNMLKTLEQAEENYQNTGKRSLISVNGMSKLLEEKTNSKTDIADMKYIMNCASKNYHSTIMFYSKDPSKFAPGILEPHRVGLKVNVPFDMNIDYKMGE